MGASVGKALFDTSILIDPHPRLEPPAARSVAISVVSVGELRAGTLLARDEQRRVVREQRLRRVRRTYAALPIDEEVADRYGEALATARREGRSTKATDLLIIATASVTGRTLYTLDHAQAALARSLGVPVVAPD